MKAFPLPFDSLRHPINYHGMDLRDYFAAKAMQAILTNSDAYFSKIREVSKEKNADADIIMAGISYVYADAMMKARE